MMLRRTWMGVCAAFALASLTPLSVQAAGEGAEYEEAHAQKAAEEEVPACPPGAFCEETTVTPPEIAEDPGEEVAAEVGGEGEGKPVTVVIPPPAPGSDPSEPRIIEYHPDPEGGPGQVIVYENGNAPPRVAGELPDPPPPPKAKKDRHRIHRHRRWGMNLRVNGVLMPRFRDDVNGEAGMAGLGFSLRYRPTPGFALDMSADFLGGVDANGYERQELPLGVTGMIYVNPRSVAQFYLMAGMNWSFARVYSDQWKNHLANGTGDDYVYFGGHGGAGLEFRVSPLIGINLDGLTFVRTRTDDDADGRFPEFVDHDAGETSNTSVAGMLRAGVTFWW